MNLGYDCNNVQVRFRKGEAVRLEGVAGTAEGNPLLQADPQFYDFFEDKATDLTSSHCVLVTTIAIVAIIQNLFQTLQTKWKNLAVDWDGGLPSII